MTRKPPNEGGNGSSKIRSFSERTQVGENWRREANCTGTGACHVKTFHTKLTPDAMTYMDQQINEWLDEHPGYEVKLVTTSIGEWSGKMGVEPHLICQVWI